MKKYRTKSGKVEEKLPGVNATVSKSEKAQIAMAGGANTISDVQAILGTPGKKNNLKGQGAKHLMSFQWGDDEAFGAPGGEEESDVNQGAVDAAAGIAAGLPSPGKGGSYSGGGGFQDPSGGVPSASPGNFIMPPPIGEKGGTGLYQFAYGDPTSPHGRTWGDWGFLGHPIDPYSTKENQIALGNLVSAWQVSRTAAMEDAPFDMQTYVGKPSGVAGVPGLSPFDPRPKPTPPARPPTPPQPPTSNAGQLNPTPIAPPPSFDTGYPGSGSPPPRLSDIPTPLWQIQEEQKSRATAAASSLKARLDAQVPDYSGRSYLDPDELDPFAPTPLLSPLDPDPVSGKGRKTGPERDAVMESIAKERETFAKDYAKEHEQSLIDKARQFRTENPELVAGGGLVLDLASTAVTKGTAALAAAFPPALFAAAAGYVFNKAMNQPKTVGETAAMEDIGASYGSTEQTAAMEDIGAIPTPPPPPDPGSDPEIQKPKKRKKIPPTTDSNNVTLLPGGPTRQQLRQQRGGFRRYV